MSVWHAVESQESKNILVNKVLQTRQEIFHREKMHEFFLYPKPQRYQWKWKSCRVAKYSIPKHQPVYFDLHLYVFLSRSDHFVRICDRRYVTKGWITSYIMLSINRRRMYHTILTESLTGENRPPSCMIWKMGIDRCSFCLNTISGKIIPHDINLVNVGERCFIRCLQRHFYINWYKMVKACIYCIIMLIPNYLPIL